MGNFVTVNNLRAKNHIPLKIEILRYALKKNDIIWESFPNVGPPPPPNPPFWEPLIQKKSFSVYFGSCLLVFISVYYY